MRRPEKLSPLVVARERPRVALLIETSNAYARGLLRGVMNYVREHRPWTLRHDEFRRGDVVPDWLQNWQADGILARIENPTIAKATLKLKRPGVDLSAARLVPEWPCVETDDAAIGRLVAEHLLERGFENFAYLGDDRFNWSRLRRAAFLSAIATAGFPCCQYHSPAAPGTLEMTTTISAGNEAAAQPSISACMLLPRPDMRIAAFSFAMRSRCR